MLRQLILSSRSVLNLVNTDCGRIIAKQYGAVSSFAISRRNFCQHDDPERFSSSSDEEDSDERPHWWGRHMMHPLPRPQDHAPPFEGMAVINRQFKQIKLSDYSGKWLILFFYPLDFTFVCPTEITAFSDRAEDFKANNCEVVACSTDSHFSHLAWINTPRKEGGLGDMKIPVLSDFNKEISTQYGVLLKELGAALRGLFLIDPKGVIKHICVNDLPVGRSVDEALRTLQAFQFVEKHGEVCPANWKPSSASIKPNPEGSKEYFKKVKDGK